MVRVGDALSQIWCYRPPVSAGFTPGIGYCDDVLVRKYVSILDRIR